jgi:hypothetical protein
MGESFKSLGKTQPFTVSLATNALLLLVSHVTCESFKSLGKTQPFTVSLATNALLLLVSIFKLTSSNNALVAKETVNGCVLPNDLNDSPIT